MSYLVLARKFRPQTFASVAGQDHITKAIANAIVRNRVPHAFLFTGPRGVGKTTTARLVARALNCTGRPIPVESELQPQADTRELVEPCGSCTNCVEIARGSSMAVWEIDGASNNSVENVRELIESLRSLPPPNTNYKIYIIDEVHMLSVAAFNALLKSLEEPPPNTIFVFATTEAHKIPETVISRCQRHDFLRIPLETIVEQLQHIVEQEKLSVQDEVLTFVARRAQGGMRDAQSMFDRLIAFADGELRLEDAQRVFSVLDEGFCLRLSRAVLDNDPSACISLIDEVFQSSVDVRAFVQDFLRHWRNLLLVSVERSAAPGTPREAILRKALEMTTPRLEQFRAQVEAREALDFQRLFDLAEETAQRAIGSAFPRYVLEAGLAKMASLASMRPLEEILQRLENGMVGTGASGGASAHSAASAQSSGRDSEAPAGESRQVAQGGRLSASLLAASSLAANSMVSNSMASTTPPAAPASGPHSGDVAKSEKFDPSWQEFIAHVRSRRELVLETYLKRSTPRRFSAGELSIEGAAFDCAAMQDKDTLLSLKRALHSYSGTEQWDVRFFVHQSAPQESAPPTTAQGAGKTADAGSAPRRAATAAVPGSLADTEAKAQDRRRKEIESEALSDPAVKATLDIFEGSTVERVSLVTTPRG